MPDTTEIIKVFINNFVVKDSRERSFTELSNPKKRGKFTGRLNHTWDSVLKMSLLTAIDKTADHRDAIQKKLNIKDDELVYVISNYEEVDDQLLSFKEVFPFIYSRGLGTVLITTNGDTMFLETEQENGPANRFIGAVKRD